MQACVCNGCKKVCGVGGLLDLANVDETSAVHDGILGICVLSCARAALMKRCVRFYHFATSICAITLRLGNSLTSLGIIRRVFPPPSRTCGSGRAAQRHICCPCALHMPFPFRRLNRTRGPSRPNGHSRIAHARDCRLNGELGETGREVRKFI